MNEDLMLRSHIQVGKVIRIKVIASGINNESILENLKELDCDQGEGTKFYPSITPKRLHFYSLELRTNFNTLSLCNFT